MRILIISQYFYPENFRVNTLAKELVKRGNEVTVLTGYPQYPQGEIYDGYGFDIPYEKKWNGINIERIKVQPRGKSAIGLLLNCLTFVTEGYKWVKKCKVRYDVVYVFEVSPVTVGLPAIKYKKKFKTPVLFNVQDLWPENVEEVLGIHNSIVIGVINKIVDKIYNGSDKILCASHGFVENIARRGVKREKLIFWPQFCEKPNFSNGLKPEVYSDDLFNIVFTGNIGDAQGLDLLIEAAEELKSEPIKWFLVGDGRARVRLEELVTNKNLSEKVVFLGQVSEAEANRYVSFADCAYLSFRDCQLFDLTIPAKLQTYLACGTPILGAVGGESAEIIESCACGVISKRNVESISEKVNELRNMEQNQINAMREAGQRCFEDRFDLDRLINKLIIEMSRLI